MTKAKVPPGGFTLLEVAVGMLIVGVLLGGALLITGKVWQHDLQEETRLDLLKDKSALLAFARTNKRLPMMDITNQEYNYDDYADGREDFISGDDRYILGFGWIPYKDIGTKGRDRFGKPIQYAVNWQLTKDNNDRPCQALRNLLRGKILAMTYGSNCYAFRQMEWDSLSTCWNPRLHFIPNPAAEYQFQLPVQLPVAAVLVSSGQDLIFNGNNPDVYTTMKYFDVGDHSGTFGGTYYDDIVVSISLEEAYESLQCQ